MAKISIALSADEISVQYDDREILNKLSLHVLDNEIICLLGQSGSGKTTVLKAIAGMLPLQHGLISLYGQQISSVQNIVSADKRRIGIIFQDYALFPHMTVFENICFGMKVTKLKTRKSAKSLLKLIKMEGYESYYPHELSGGQQQRVAIARALAIKPKALLLDEPFSNVDFHLRQQLMTDIRHILKQSGIAAIFVTHSKEEAFLFADKLAFMEDGKIVQTGSAEDLYYQPQSEALAESMGKGSWVNVIVVDQHRTLSEDLGEIISTTAHGFEIGQKVKQFIRPNQISLKVNEAGRGKITEQFFNGDTQLHIVIIDGLTMMVNQPSVRKLPVDTRVSVTVTAHPAIIFEFS